ncbi:hypothetical protein [Anatilimnocola floriformis]|uniref:hypothetical protein n=1 Tax=Anatilimnocola floriformis TaxID=2948575 RepID=UPI0020C3E374|nr:hypothetical protein [Anatilimnocola floriformis]
MKGKKVIKKGQQVRFKPELSDPGDDNIVFLAVDDESKGRVTVVALLGLVINPTQVVSVSMVAEAADYEGASK